MVLASRKIVAGAVMVLVPWGFFLEAGQGGQTLATVPSVKTSILKSVLVPGLGEFGLGRPGRGRLLTQTEVALWLILAESVRSANRYQSRLRSFGAVHAGVDFSGKNDQFFVNVESYSSMELYNEAQLRARLPNKVYREEEGYGWTWDSDDNRRIYRRFRVHRDVLRKAGQFVMGGMVLNRIVSVIDVTYLHRLRELRPDVSIVLMGDGSTGGVRVILTRRF